jgi:hypothetical protein
MHESPERPSHDLHRDVRRAHEDADEESVAWVDQKEHAVREAGSSRGQLNAIGRAADDTIEDDDVSGTDRVSPIEHVCDPERAPAFDALVACKFPGIWLVRGDELDDLAPGGARGEQFGLNRPDAATDLQNA